MSSSTADSACVSLPWSATFAPSRANRAAIAAPIPRELPVTNATLSFNRSILVSLCSKRRRPSSVACRRHARDSDRQQGCGDALAPRHAMAQSLGFAESGEFAQGRRAHHALDAEGEERAQRSDGEEVAWRAQRTVMKVKPQHPAGHDCDRGGTHLRPEVEICLIAARAS